MAFSGSLSLEDDARPLRVNLELTSTELVLATATGRVGSWSLEESRIEASGDRFLVIVGRERAWFTPDDPIPFNRQILERWGAPTLAAAVEAARAAAGPPEAEPSPPAGPVPFGGGKSNAAASAALSNLSTRQRWQLGVIGALMLVAILVAAGSGERSRSTPLLGPVSTTGTPSLPIVFAGGLDRIPALWNDAAGGLGLELFLTETGFGRRLQVAVAEDLFLFATTDPATGLVRTLMISAGPGQGEHGQVVLAMWGTLLAMVNPELGPEGRRAVLERLGVDVDRPLAIGLDTETIEGRARYRLRSGVIGGRIWLSVAPAA
ncbi:MAG TPA: hypothetical protein VLA54_11865 [Acidimicrobiia bacterium]|nr:hypothetical protein [Acidimicrobiia bacterium]